ncbi:hybrid signal transduction histidine kinase E isoform X2 [Episyrphus balteatus]|uniref:hybrid signal transduction histidine kinase E isoform X2 n=1 Tax=Episyrphus balteatus TaxID=286459 RepID=UPI0024852C67|nr:hybrid signal transduction histidine kinase E isoform X2 [Episyrphus balteatus]
MSHLQLSVPDSIFSLLEFLLWFETHHLGLFNNNCDVHLHAEIEVLKQALIEKQSELIAMETACLRESDRQVELEDSIIAWQDKYDRLYESHKRVQKVNQTLEDKLLKLVDRNSGERAQLTSDVATLSVRLAQANYNIAKLQREIERYKADINLAIQLLQCKPDSFVPQKVSSLPIDIQSKVSSYMRLETNSHSDSEGSTSGVGVATSGSYKVLPASDSPPPACPFPPTAMVYSMRGLDGSNPNSNTNNNSNCNNNENNNNNNNNNNGDQMISPSTMAKFLEDELKANEVKHCDTCQCSTKDLTVLADVQRSYAVATQTPLHGETNSSLCLRCNSNLNSPSRTNSPYIMKLVKSSDSVISETKSSVSDLNDCDKLFTPAKRDDLMVNPILGHHRLCDRTASKYASLLQQQQQQQQNLYTDTAKYVLENNRKFAESCDLIDLRKYSDKSPGKQGVTATTAATTTTASCDISKTTTCGAATKEQAPALSRKIETPDEMRLSSSSGNVQGKLLETSDDLEKKNDDTEKSNLRSGMSGSMNSVWSKTSSCEGAKMFENFNRNLIKTIKAENPKYRGPRLCAMRIQQNGQSNILLDNMESPAEATPIIYTRRQRFLDEELDDTKDIITSKISMVMTNQTQVDVVVTSNGNASTEAATTIAKRMSNDKLQQSCDIANSSSENNINCKMDLSSSNNNLSIDLINDTTPLLSVTHSNNPQPSQSQPQQQQQQQQPLLPPSEVNIDRQLTNSYLEQQFKNLVTTEQQQQLLKASLNYDMLHHNEVNCKASVNSKSCTQSSSISDTIDLQESVLLRRQQLNRVAEWVQHNSQLEQQQPINDHSETYASMEKLSMDSGYKTVNQQPQSSQPPQSHHHQEPLNTSSKLTSSATSTYQYEDTPKHGYRHHLDNFQAPSESKANYMNGNGNGNQQSLQEVVNNYKYRKDSDNNSNKPVDIAQMEYNVKQFLLKQNEWSMRSTKNHSTATSSNFSNTPSQTPKMFGSNPPGMTNGELTRHRQQHQQQQQAMRMAPHRTETNL